MPTVPIESGRGRARRLGDPVDGATQRRFASLRSHGDAACRPGRRAKRLRRLRLVLSRHRTKRRRNPPTCEGPSRISRTWPFASRRSDGRSSLCLSSPWRLATGCRRPAVPGDTLVEDHHTLEPAIPFAGEQSPVAAAWSLPALLRSALRKDASPMMRACGPSVGAGPAASLRRARRTPWPGCDRLGSS